MIPVIYPEEDGKWKNWIFGAALWPRQHDAVMAFITGHLLPPASDVCPRDICILHLTDQSLQPVLVELGRI